MIVLDFNAITANQTIPTLGHAPGHSLRRDEHDPAANYGSRSTSAPLQNPRLAMIATFRTWQ